MRKRLRSSTLQNSFLSNFCRFFRWNKTLRADAKTLETVSEDDPMKSHEMAEIHTVVQCSRIRLPLLCPLSNGWTLPNVVERKCCFWLDDFWWTLRDEFGNNTDYNPYDFFGNHHWALPGGCTGKRTYEYHSAPPKKLMSRIFFFFVIRNKQ